MTRFPVFTLQNDECQHHNKNGARKGERKPDTVPAQVCLMFRLCRRKNWVPDGDLTPRPAHSHTRAYGSVFAGLRCIGPVAVGNLFPRFPRASGVVYLSRDRVASNADFMEPHTPALFGSKATTFSPPALASSPANSQRARRDADTPDCAPLGFSLLHCALSCVLGIWSRAGLCSPTVPHWFADRATVTPHPRNLAGHCA